jgi:fimbrial isopeptide formation D2 family protein/LPXTG-motif cell wall-anchored protein
MKKLISLVLALAMVALCGLSIAESYGIADQAHTITITSQGTGVHNYEAYQVFVGNLDAAEGKLTDIQWGSGVKSEDLLTALKTDVTTGSAMASATTATDVAKALEGKAAAFVEAFAKLVGANLSTTKAGTGASSGGTNNTATVSVTGDGYYFVKDVTPTLADGDTYSKFMLDVVKDVDVTAKDTTFAPDKKILKAQGADFTRVSDDSSAIGDTVTFEVKIIIPDTTNYVDHFIMNMVDQLPTGLTLMGISSVKANGNDVPAANYTMTAKTGSGDFATYTAPASVEDAVAAAGGQTMKIVYNEFKSYVETNKLIGKELVVTYTAVVNDDAVFGPTGNENEVKYIYSNDPNHDYDGDEPGSGDPTGETPESKTKTVVTQLKILKVDGANDNPLAGAEFTVTGTAFNYVIKQGEKFTVAEDGTWYKLKDGSYTETVPGSTVDGVVINDTQYENKNVKYKRTEYNEVEATAENYKHVGITNSQGIFMLSGLKPGTYTIEETHAPDGYNKITETKTLVITWSLADGFGLSAESTAAGFTMINNGVEYDITIQNNQGTTLPSTGGMGTTIFYIVGGLLLVGAAIVLISRRKAND